MQVSIETRAIGFGVAQCTPKASPTEIWRTFRSLIEVRSRLGVSAQALATLRALISFLKEGEGVVVYASNRTISARAEGISERTIRRHISVLTSAGLLARQDSANGKRYKLAHPDNLGEAFGLDLSPIVARASEIEELAEEVARERKLVSYWRKKLSALIYRADCTAAHTELVAEMRPALRRKLSSTALEDLCSELEAALATGEPAAHEDPPVEGDALDMTPSDHPPARSEVSVETELSANNGQSVRHKISSKKEHIDSDCDPSRSDAPVVDAALLRKIADACPGAMSFAERRPVTWWELEAHAWTLAGWCGIGPDLLAAATLRIGKQAVALTVLGLSERMQRIRNVPAYFNAITMGRKSEGYDALKLVFSGQPRKIGAAS